MKKLISIVIVASMSLFAFACGNGTAINSDTENTTETGELNEQPAQKTINKVISEKEFSEQMKLEGAQIIDVRTPGEVSGGFIEGAVNIDYQSDDFKERIGQLDKNKPVLVYCHSGGRSGKTAAMLKEMGFTEVYDLEGGYSNWSKK